MNRYEPQNTPLDERVYRNIDLSREQIDRLPLYVKIALAYADAKLNQIAP